MGETGNIFNRGALLSRLASSGQWDRLLDATREWLAEEPESPGAHRYAAQSLINLGRHREAEPHLRTVLTARPDDDLALRMLSLVQFELRRFPEADESIRRALAIDPNDANHWYHLARMCYAQKDRESGLKWIAKARELAPHDADILNLYALCTSNAEEQTALLREALALDPENPFLHNNLGTHYLDRTKEYAKAEECFRRALAISPALKVARNNLFTAVKHRDMIYRALCVPRDFLLKLRHSILGREGRNPMAIGLGLLVWLFLFRFVIGGLLLWFAFVWPMLKVYEWLVVGDIRAKAGEVGARRGGFLRYRQWSLRLRLALFGVALLGFWLGVYLLVARETPTTSFQGGAAANVVTLAVIAAMIGLLIYFGRKFLTGLVRRFHSWRRNRRLKHLAT